jgi:hypothetical protein
VNNLVRILDVVHLLNIAVDKDNVGLLKDSTFLSAFPRSVAPYPSLSYLTNLGAGAEYVRGSVDVLYSYVGGFNLCVGADQPLQVTIEYAIYDYGSGSTIWKTVGVYNVDAGSVVMLPSITDYFKVNGRYYRWRVKNVGTSATTWIFVSEMQSLT